MKNKRNAWLPFIVSAVFLTVVNLPAADKNIVLKASVDFLGDHQIESGGSTEVRTGYSLSSELHFNHSTKFRYGMGVTYQIPREQLIDGNTGKKFSFYPVYGLLEYNISPSLAVNPALIIQGGYNFYYGNGFYRGQSNLNGGFYVAAGANLALHENLRLELLYKWNRGTVNEASQVKIDYRYISFALCIIF